MEKLCIGCCVNLVKTSRGFRRELCEKCISGEGLSRRDLLEADLRSGDYILPSQSLKIMREWESSAKIKGYPKNLIDEVCAGFIENNYRKDF